MIMSEAANVQLVQDAYAAFQRGDIPGLLNSLSDDIEWVEPAVPPLGGVYRGKDGVAEFFRKVGETSEFASFEPQRFVAQGDHVIALGHYNATVRATGRTYDSDWAMLFVITGGKISKFQEFTDTAAFASAVSAAAAAAA
jgi:ketosteroid isomerase-like protein